MTKDDRRAFEVPDRLFEYVRAVVDNRALATVLLFLLSLLLIGIDNIVGILAVLLIGFLLIDRFEIVDRRRRVDNYVGDRVHGAWRYWRARIL